MIASARPCPPVPPVNLHGKEGVSGSSPEEGLKIPVNRVFLLSGLVQSSTSFLRKEVDFLCFPLRRWATSDATTGAP